MHGDKTRAQFETDIRGELVGANRTAANPRAKENKSTDRIENRKRYRPTGLATREICSKRFYTALM